MQVGGSCHETKAKGCDLLYHHKTMIKGSGHSLGLGLNHQEQSQESGPGLEFGSRDRARAMVRVRSGSGSGPRSGSSLEQIPSRRHHPGQLMLSAHPARLGGTCTGTAPEVGAIIYPLPLCLLTCVCIVLLQNLHFLGVLLECENFNLDI